MLWSGVTLITHTRLRAVAAPPVRVTVVGTESQLEASPINCRARKRRCETLLRTAAGQGICVDRKESE